MSAEHDPERRHEPQGSPVLDRVAEPLVLDHRLDREDVGQRAREKPRRADRRKSGGETPHHPAEALEHVPHRSEEEQGQEVEQDPVELDQRPGGGVRPAGRDKRPHSVEHERRTCYRQRTAQPRQRILGKQHAKHERSGQDQSRHRARSGKIAPGLKGEIDRERPDERGGQDHAQCSRARSEHHRAPSAGARPGDRGILPGAGRQGLGGSAQ